MGLVWLILVWDSEKCEISTVGIIVLNVWVESDVTGLCFGPFSFLSSAGYGIERFFFLGPLGDIGGKPMSNFGFSSVNCSSFDGKASSSWDE